MSTRFVTSRAADVNPPSTQSSPSMITPLASNRASEPGAATIQVKLGAPAPASAASELDVPASAEAEASPAQAGAAGPRAVRDADEEHPTAVAISPTANRIVLATAASLPASTTRDQCTRGHRQATPARCGGGRHTNHKKVDCGATSASCPLGDSASLRGRAAATPLATELH